MKKLSHSELGKLLEKARAGDTSAFYAIYDATYQIQLSTALRNTQNQALAEEVVQEVYIYLYQNMDKIRNNNLLVAYLNRINYSYSARILSKEKGSTKIDLSDVEPILVDPNPTPEESFKNKSQTELVNMALSEMDDTLRSVLIYRYVDEMPIAEICSTMKTSRRTVFRYLSKGAKQMKSILEKLKDKYYSIGLFCLPFVARTMRAVTHSADVSNKSAVLSRIQEAANIPTNTAGFNIGTYALASVSIWKAIGITTAAAATVTAGSVTVAQMPRYEIAPLAVTQGYISGQVEYRITPQMGSEIRQVNVYDSEGNLYLSASGLSDYTLSFTENGTYKVQIYGNGVLDKKETVVIDSFDQICPEVSAVTYGDDYDSFTAYDNESGINWSASYAVDASGNPVEWFVESGTVYVKNIYSTVRVVIQDQMGNSTTVTIQR